MKPAINVQETPGKTVGWRKPPSDSFKAGMELQRLAIDLGKSFQQGLVPRGVYRFHSHHEANQWMLKMLARQRKNSVS